MATASTNASTKSPTIFELFDLSGKVALITGGTGYLGAAMSDALAEAGARVIISSRSKGRAETAVAALPEVSTGDHFGIRIDYQNPPLIEESVAEMIQRAGRIDVLVNNGQESLAEDLTTVTADQFNRQLAMATGYFLLARDVAEHARRRGGGASIIMLGSMYGLVGSYPDAYEGICPASPVAYHTLKGGIVQMTRHLAVYWAADGVRVNCLSPGPFPPDTVDARLHERLGRKCPMGRMGKPFELKGAIVFLASDASSYVTGQNLVVDGGWTAW